MSDKLLEQYKLCVQTADRVLARKQHANVFFFAVNAVIIMVMITFVVYARHVGVALDLLSYALLGMSAVGVISGMTWCYLLEFYHKWSRAKYEVVQRIEERLGYQPHLDERAILRCGKDKPYYRPLAGLETYAPLVFFPFYMVSVILALVWLSSSG